MITDKNVERRCRYRLARHGLKVHKVKECCGPVFFACYDDDDPPEWQRHYMDLYELLDFAEVLAEKDAEYKADRWNHGKNR